MKFWIHQTTKNYNLKQIWHISNAASLYMHLATRCAFEIGWLITIKMFLWAENDVTAFIIFEKLIKKPRRETHKAYHISKVHNIMQIDNKRVANLRCSEYFTQRHISQKCQLNTFEIIMNFFVNINIILKEIERKTLL